MVPPGSESPTPTNLPTGSSDKTATRPSWRSKIGPRALKTLAILGLIVCFEYIVLPKLIATTKDFHLLGRLRPGWVAAAVVAEIGSFAAYTMLLSATLTESRLGFGRMLRIVLATTAFGHVVPAAAVAGPGFSYRLLTESGVDGANAGFALGTASMGSAVVLNLMLWICLLVSIPFAGFHPIYVITALLSLLLITAAALVLYALTRGEDRAIRIVRAIGRHIPGVGADRMESVIRELTAALQRLSGNKPMVRAAAGWAALNWALDAGTLWCMLAALGHYTEPFGLFAAYGIGNVLAVIPVTPGGLGVVEATVPALLVSFGVPGSTATFGVLGWRLLQYWLPMPVGAIAYLSLRREGHARRQGSQGRSSDPDRPANPDP